MKKIELGTLVGILANVGVIVGIMFLAVEIRQNNLLLRAEAIGTVLETRIARQELVINNDSLVSTLAKNSRGEALTDEDMIRLEAEMYRKLLGRQRDYFLYQAGILTEENFRVSFPLMKNSMSVRDDSYSYLDFWNARKMISASATYREFVEQCILSSCETIPR